jgi:two-component system NtrC family sensor kinase
VADRDDEVIDAALATERGDVGARVNVARMLASACWLALALALGIAGRGEWLVPAPALAAWVAIAVVLHAARTTRLRRWLHLAVPLVDLPLIAIVQCWFLTASTRPQVVAATTVGILAVLVFMAQLSFALRGIVATAIGAAIAAAIVLWYAELPLPNLYTALLLLGFAAAIASVASARTRQLVATVARARRTRETELAALVAARTSELTERNAELEQALATLAKTQADLVRAERMASVAALVQGIAHELNNPIGYIAGNVPHLQRYVQFLGDAARALGDGRARTPDELAAIVKLDDTRDLAFVTRDLAALTADIAEGARRAKLIVGDLHGLTAATGRAIEDVDLARVIDQTRQLLAARVTAGVALELEVEPVPAVRAPSGQLEQVLINLVDNALRAVVAGGTVRIRLSRDGDDAVVAVTDNGCGMTAEQRERATEPFFTTRASGEGAGLGLAIVASIVEANRGGLEIASVPDGGTTVTVRLPTVVNRSAGTR